MSEKLDIEFLKALCRDDIPAMQSWRALFMTEVPKLIARIEELESKSTLGKVETDKLSLGDMVRAKRYMGYKARIVGFGTTFDVSGNEIFEEKTIAFLDMPIMGEVAWPVEELTKWEGREKK